MATPKRRRRVPKRETLSMDWFLVPHGSPVDNSVNENVDNFVSNQGSSSLKTDRDIDIYNYYYPAVDNFLDPTLQDDPRGCHSNLAEHLAGLRMCAHTLRASRIRNPFQFLERWTTNEILTGLDVMLGQELQGNVIDHPAGWLWSYLSRPKGGGDAHR